MNDRQNRRERSRIQSKWNQEEKERGGGGELNRRRRKECRIVGVEV